jgi:hypothetical protein
MRMNDKYIYTCRENTAEISYCSQLRFERIEETVDNNVIQAKGGLQDGSTYINSNLQTRQITIYGSINTLKSEFLQLERQLKKTFTPKHLGILSFIQNGITKEIECIAENVVSIKRNYAKLEFKIDLTACNPYWNLKDNVNIFNLIEPTFFFDNSLIDTTFGIVTDIQETDIYNIGDVTTGLKIYFKARATVTNPYVTDTINNKSIKITTILNKNDELEIISFPYKKEIIINGKNSITKLDRSVSSFFYMEEGRNRFKYGADTNGNQLDFIMSYKPLFL